MKTLKVVWFEYVSIPGGKCRRALYLLTGILLLCRLSLSAQDIVIKNPSFEGNPAGGLAPNPWLNFEGSVDTHPGACCGVTYPASDGNTYIGMMASVKWTERVAQELQSPLEAGKTYMISFDMAKPYLYYGYNICFGGLKVYGANSTKETGDELWKSEVFIHGDWKSYTAVFTPQKNYKYLIMGPYFDSTCKYSYSAVYLDNLSKKIREVPQITLIARNTCKNSNNGEAKVIIKSGIPPYTFTWNPGGFNNSSISNLEKGEYEVTVVSDNGTFAKGKVQIDENELNVTTALSYPLCSGDDNGRIQITAGGGVAPYAYSIHGADFSSSGTFENIRAGTYHITVKDSYDCELRINNILVKEPDKLVVSEVSTQNVSCSSVMNGSIGFTVTGGTRPYSYSIGGEELQDDSIFRKLDGRRYYYVVKDSHDCNVKGDVVITTEWRDCAVFMPTAFSPNGDGKNDIFKAKVHDAVTDFRLAVYGRWGQLVFETRDPARGWDGSRMSAGNYLWIVTYTDSKQQLIQQKGDVVLIR